MESAVGKSISALDDLAEFINTSRTVSRALNEALAEEDLREDHWRIMHALNQRPGMFMGEIAEGLTLPAATTTRLIDQLTDRGFVFRRSTPDDGRSAAVHLSRKGHEKLDRAVHLIDARLAHLQLPVVPSA